MQKCLLIYEHKYALKTNKYSLDFFQRKLNELDKPTAQITTTTIRLLSIHPIPLDQPTSHCLTEIQVQDHAKPKRNIVKQASLSKWSKRETVLAHHISASDTKTAGNTDNTATTVDDVENCMFYFLFYCKNKWRVGCIMRPRGIARPVQECAVATFEAVNLPPGPYTLAHHR